MESQSENPSLVKFISKIGNQCQKFKKQHEDSINIESQPLGYEYFPSEEEMKKYGNIHYIHDAQELDNWLIEEKQFKNKEYPRLYRGHADASWIMKTTLLRLVEMIGCDFTCAQQKHLQNVRRVLDDEGTHQKLALTNEDQLLFYAQHYDKKSALLDFTRDPNIALFFASEKESAVNVNSDLADYISIITLDTRRESDFFNWRNVYQVDNCESVVELLERVNQPIWIAEENLSNKRMTAQKGAFVYLSKHSNCSVEAVFKAMTDERGWNPLITYNLISRKLIPHIKDILRKHDITRRTLCLEEN